ncbi:glycine cleavage system aminomethyltransferase GcvT [Blattabacterium cuenoti]|uniref:glycine cleavage system aminomethyltransferase GcvT n=1 Tax=Blattabacterium cuenoti TaxID=1653831 RepID=UPI00293BABA1|nr:glycine cleavage system aminomethyltransferase GcvT [Blattabacterium cuenoti]
MMEIKNLKKTSLYDVHVKLNAKIINFSGFYMPVQYKSSLEEHMYVRNYSGLFDVSHMGKLIVKGKNSKKILQYLTTNDLSKISPGQAQYTCFTNENGGIIDDLVIYCLKHYEYLLIVNAINIEKNKKWILKNKKNNLLKLIDFSEKYSLLAIQGPLSIVYIQKLTSIILDKIPFYHFKIGDLCGIKNVLISNTGYTGSAGIEIYVSNKYVKSIWNNILNIGNGKIIPCGISSRNSLRLEMGYRLYGQDISENITPIESGLSWIVNFKKNFISKDILIKQKKSGVYKKFLSFYINDLKVCIPRNGHKIIDEYNNIIGFVTSGSYSPIIKKCIGLGYLYKNYSKITNMFILIRNKKISIKIKKLPFIKIKKVN